MHPLHSKEESLFKHGFFMKKYESKRMVITLFDIISIIIQLNLELFYLLNKDKHDIDLAYKYIFE